MDTKLTTKDIRSAHAADMNLNTKRNTLKFDIITLILPGTIRSKKNSREPRTMKTKTGKLIKFMGASKKYREWETRARQAAETLLKEIGITGPLEGEYRLEVKVYMKGPLLDLDAAHTAVQDALEGIVWKNDKQVKRYSEESGVWRDKAYPRTEVVITRLARYAMENDAIRGCDRVRG
jgi:Holliday junction resolvase RusA-like endonuclease